MLPKVLEGARRSKPMGLMNGKLYDILASANSNACVSETDHLHVKQEDGVAALHS